MAEPVRGLAREYDERTRALMLMQRILYGSPYVPDEVIAREVSEFLRGEPEDISLRDLRLNYLFNRLWLDRGPVRGATYPRVYGNFMGTIGALGVAAESARLDGIGLASADDSYTIVSLVGYLLEYSGVFRWRCDGDVPNTIEASAAYYIKALERLHQILIDPAHRMVVSTDGSLQSPEDIKGDGWLRKRKDGSMGEGDGSLPLVSSDGVRAIKAWVDQISPPLSFLRSGLVPNAEIDRFGRMDQLPAPHPAYASSVNRILMEILLAAERNEVSLVRVQKNSWRETDDVTVPTAEVPRFREMITGHDAQVTHKRRRDEWYIEHMGDRTKPDAKVRIVIPTQPLTHVRRFRNTVGALWNDLNAVNRHVYDLARAGNNLDVEKPGEDGVSLRGKLERVMGDLQTLSSMQRVLKGIRTQEAYAVHELIARLTHVTGEYAKLYRYLGNENALRLQVTKCLRNDVFSIFNFIPATRIRDSVPNSGVEVVSPRPYVRPVNWAKTYELMSLFFVLAARIAGTPDEDSEVPRNVKTMWSWTDWNNSIVIKNEEGRLADVLESALSLQSDTVVPRLAEDIVKFAGQVAPSGQSLHVDRERNLIFLPLNILEPVQPGAGGVEIAGGGWTPGNTASIYSPAVETSFSTLVQGMTRTRGV